jgi:uncharacterized membrane protein required for colicin V production
MGLDLALSGVVVLAAIRGWFRGFTSQALRIVGFVACFYAANPIRDLARPQVLPRFPAIDPSLLDRILWWVSAAAAYVVLVGISTLAVKLLRTPPEPGAIPSNRDDRIAGLLLGAAKGLLLAALLASGIQKYGGGFVNGSAWMQEQWDQSTALRWNRKYQPILRIWESPPVQRFISHLQRNGLPSGVQPEEEAKKRVAELEREPGNPAAPRLEISPSDRAWGSDGTGEGELDSEIARLLEDAKSTLKGRSKGN